jgi:hypothetical protein
LIAANAVTNPVWSRTSADCTSISIVFAAAWMSRNSSTLAGTPPLNSTLTQKRQPKSIQRRRSHSPSLAPLRRPHVRDRDFQRRLPTTLPADGNEDRYLMSETATCRTRTTKGFPRWSMT